MKILILSDDFPPEVAGGAGMMAFRTAKEFAKLGHDVRVFSATSQTPHTSTFAGLTIYRFHSSYHERWRSWVSLWNPVAIKELKKVIGEFKPDVVHAHNIHAHISYVALLVAKKKVSRVYMTAHDIMSFYPGTFTEFINPKDMRCPDAFDYRVTVGMLLRKFRLRYNPFRNVAVRRILRKIDGVIAVSNALREALIQNKIGRVSVIRNGIDLVEWNGEAAQKSESKTVLFGGRLSGAKGGEVILQAMQQVTATVPDAKLVVAGKKDFYAERMQKRIQEIGIAEHVVFTGWLSEEQMKEAYLSAAVVVTPSVCFDSFPNTNLEAFAAGRPVVATCFGGSREIVANNQNGYIVNPFDISSLATSISTLLLDPEKAAQFGASGRRFVVEKFSIEKMAELYLNLFRIDQ